MRGALQGSGVQQARHPGTALQPCPCGVLQPGPQGRERQQRAEHVIVAHLLPDADDLLGRRGGASVQRCSPQRGVDAPRARAQPDRRHHSLLLECRDELCEGAGLEGSPGCCAREDYGNLLAAAIA